MRGKGERPDEAILGVCDWCLVYQDISVSDLAVRIWEHQAKRKKVKRFAVEDVGMLIAKMADEEYHGPYHDGAAKDFLEFMRFLGMVDFGNEPMKRTEQGADDEREDA